MSPRPATEQMLHEEWAIYECLFSPNHEVSIALREKGHERHSRNGDRKVERKKGTKEQGRRERRLETSLSSYFPHDPLPYIKDSMGPLP